ncbi:hypothetical protein Bca52824_016163 [Brassica carinata]|uniref:Uncharacterized protein n=1 Tax=Brassica carinata TaxID=52824 RepID=A0A8X7W5W6_BRACI|nr:hypothetical protein Bca52824_016163 [Brassica carinata]
MRIATVEQESDDNGVNHREDEVSHGEGEYGTTRSNHGVEGAKDQVVSRLEQSWFRLRYHEEDEDRARVHNGLKLRACLNCRERSDQRSGLTKE